MKIAITGATGFLGHYIVREMQNAGNTCRCWHRAASDRSSVGSGSACPVEWIAGELGSREDCDRLVEGCDALVHSGLHRTGASFRGSEGDPAEFVQKNIVGTIQLIEAARAAGCQRFVFISTCAVHEKILDDRPLDERHPLWATTHYGAHKAAVEQFVHSYGMGFGYPICAVRPTGIYGVHHRIEHSKWFPLIRQVLNGESVTCRRGGKEVHAADVARAVDLLLHADNVAGEAFSCYDRYISEMEIAELAKDISGSTAQLLGERTRPKHQIVCDKIQSLGMTFGGDALLRETVEAIVRHIQNEG